jgi:3-hydroxybutyryl-CoA dehydrogenase
MELGIAGGGAIACGLAAVAARRWPVRLWVRSVEAADRAQARIARLAERMGEEAPVHPIRVCTELAELRDVPVVVEAIVEALDPKVELLGQLRETLAPDALVATTTSSLSVAELGVLSGLGGRLVGLHVFNPVPRMDLIEVVVLEGVSDDVRARVFTIVEELGKTGVEVADAPGFVVNRLLFPYLCDAVRLLERQGARPEDLDRCMTLGAGHPLGPFALLDMIELDVSRQGVVNLGLEVPRRLDELLAAGRAGRKAGAGFYDYATT